MIHSEFNQELFSSRILLKRKVFNISLRDLSKKLNIGCATISRIENQRNLPDVITFYRLCNWLEIEMEFFYIKNK